MILKRGKPSRIRVFFQLLNKTIFTLKIPFLLILVGDAEP